jgi:hypothetical protein
MDLASVRIIAELRYPSSTLALAHTKTAELFNNAAQPARNQAAIIDFAVDDVDAEYQRLKPLLAPAAEDAVRRFRGQ